MSSARPDYYSILGVAKDADAAEIKKKFRRLARECHPDVAGDDPRAAARFTLLREAYETLVDPIRRDRYDNPPQRRTFYRQSWRPPGGNQFGGMGDGASAGRRSAKQRWRDPANRLDLEDIFGEQMGEPPPRGRPAPSSDFMGSSVRVEAGGGAEERSSPGEDIPLAVEITERVARLGGTITLNYARHKRSERGSNLFRYNEIYDLRIIPSTRNGEEIRIPRMGHAGTGGGEYGDLLCTVRVRAAAGGGAAERGAPRSATRSSDDLDVPISVVEALLGGRVEVAIPGGRVRLTIPPCSSSGTRLRLRGRGVDGEDLYVRLRITVPDALDAESRELIEAFAELNPDCPRD